MRNLLVPLLLASAAFPAAAIAGDEDRDAARAARAEQRIERSQQRMERADRPQRADRQERADPPQQQQQQQQQQQKPPPREMRPMRADRAPDAQPQGQAREIERQQRRMDRAPRNWSEGSADQPMARPDDVVRDRAHRGPRAITTDGLPGEVRQERLQRGDRVDRGDRLQRDERMQRIDRSEERALARRTRMPGLPPTAGQSPRPGYGGGLASTPLPSGGELRRSSSGSQWGTHWRNDRRYDWRDWRRRHRSSFNLGFYIDPFGFGYQRMDYGWRLFPSYYRSSYWLNDPWQYRLPPAYGPYRWVRY